jgi:hypothetical protein
VDNDNKDERIQRCNKANHGGDFNRPLAQLKGIWEVDRDAVEQCNNNLHELGVCYRHFLYDQNMLHNEKQEYLQTEQSKLHHTHCLLCKKFKSFFTRNGCSEHSWTVCGRSIRVPCLGLQSCKALKDYVPISTKSTNSSHSLYICSDCFEAKEWGVALRSSVVMKNIMIQQKY